MPMNQQEVDALTSRIAEMKADGAFDTEDTEAQAEAFRLKVLNDEAEEREAEAAAWKAKVEQGKADAEARKAEAAPTPEVTSALQTANDALETLETKLYAVSQDPVVRERFRRYTARMSAPEKETVERFLASGDPALAERVDEVARYRSMPGWRTVSPKFTKVASAVVESRSLRDQLADEEALEAYRKAAKGAQAARARKEVEAAIRQELDTAATEVRKLTALANEYPVGDPKRRELAAKARAVEDRAMERAEKFEGLVEAETQRRVATLGTGEFVPTGASPEDGLADEHHIYHPPERTPFAQPPLSRAALRMAERTFSSDPAEAAAAKEAMDARHPGWEDAPNSPVPVKRKLTDYERGLAGPILPQPMSWSGSDES